MVVPPKRWFPLRFPPRFPLPVVPPVDELKRNRKLTCLGFVNLHDPDRKAITFRKVAIIFCVLLEENIVAAQNCCEQSDRQRASKSCGETLFPTLCRLQAHFDGRNEDVVCEFHPSGLMAVFVGKEPAVHQFIENRLCNARFRERIIECTTVAMAAGCDELVLDKDSYAVRKTFERAPVEIGKDSFLLDVQKIWRDFRLWSTL